MSMEDDDLIECAANYVPLTPITFLDRVSRSYPNATSFIYGDNSHDSFTWKQTHQRCLKLVSSLTSLGILYGDVVATISSNIPELYELHFGVPMASGVLAPLNPSLDAPTLSLIFQELNPKFVFLHHHYIQLTLKAFNLLLENKFIPKIPFLVLIMSSENHVDEQLSIISSYTQKFQLDCLHNYEELLELGRAEFEPLLPKNECDPILINYTSGSTGNPKGVVYSHRAAYLNTIGEILRSDLRERIVFLWTADMFRANGWGFLWAIPSLGGTNVFLRNTTGTAILDSIFTHGVTHFSGHPSILLSIVEEESDQEKSMRVFPYKVYAHIAGLLPPPSVMTKIKEMGIEVVHRYGMTEVLGPPVKKLWRETTMKTQNGSSTNNGFKLNDQDLHNNLSDYYYDTRHRGRGRVMENLMEEFNVKDPNTMKSVPRDGKTIGEVMFRGNTIMKGYLNSPSKTKRVFKGGWFHTGDLAVKHQDGSIQLKDRAIDLIVNKGESVSTLEIEAVLSRHPKVLASAVVGMPLSDEDEAPCAFVKLRNGEFSSEGEIISFCKERLPDLMIPRVVIFGDLAVSSTGKVQKSVLREAAKVASSQLRL